MDKYILQYLEMSRSIYIEFQDYDVFNTVWCSDILTFSSAGEGYSGHSSCSLISIFFILFFSSTFQLCRIAVKLY